MKQLNGWETLWFAFEGENQPMHFSTLRVYDPSTAPGGKAVSNFFADIDQDECVTCGECQDRCPMDAIQEQDGAYSVMTDNCIGCGVCTITCPVEGAITLIRKPESEHEEKPPTDMHAWNIQRAANRGIQFDQTGSNKMLELGREQKRI